MARRRESEADVLAFVAEQHAKGNVLRIDGVDCPPGTPVPPPRGMAPYATVNVPGLNPAERREPKPAPAKGRKKKNDLPMVPELFIAPCTWVLPIVTASEINGREWRKRSKRSDDAWRIVSPAFGPRVDYYAHFQRHYHSGGFLRIVFTRLGGKKIDRANLGGALKATEDAVAFMLGANDGDKRWDSHYEQEPGERHGVRIEIYASGPTPTKQTA